MNPLLRSDFEEVDKNFVKKLRRKIVQQILFVRKSTNINRYKYIYNFSFFHIVFSLLFVLLPFICLSYKLSQVFANDKNNFLDSFLQEKFFNDKDNKGDNNKNNKKSNFVVENYHSFGGNRNYYNYRMMLIDNYSSFTVNELRNISLSNSSDFSGKGAK